MYIHVNSSTTPSPKPRTRPCQWRVSSCWHEPKAPPHRSGASSTNAAPVGRPSRWFSWFQTQVFLKTKRLVGGTHLIIGVQWILRYNSVLDFACMIFTMIITSRTEPQTICNWRCFLNRKDPEIAPNRLDTGKPSRYQLRWLSAYQRVCGGRCS